MANNNGSNDKKKGKVKGDRTSWIIGGTTMLGIGIGFFLFPISALFFVASIMVGIGIGLVIVPALSKMRG